MVFGKEKRPLYKELDSILSQNQKHIIIINLKDIIEHNGADVNNYPTIEGIKKFVLAKKIDTKIEMQDRVMAVIL